VTSRNVVDYGLRRRARLTDFANGRAAAAELCDAHPYLQLAARHYGEPTAQPCPICRKVKMRHVHYVYGDALRQTAGQAKSIPELNALAQRVPEFTVYLVEVCQDCGWNHLLRSFVLGCDDEREGLTAADG
jgi:hypothetical protein